MKLISIVYLKLYYIRITVSYQFFYIIEKLRHNDIVKHVPYNYEKGAGLHL